MRILENEKSLLTFTVRDVELKCHKHKDESASLQIQLDVSFQELYVEHFVVASFQ